MLFKLMFVKENVCQSFSNPELNIFSEQSEQEVTIWR